MSLLVVGMSHRTAPVSMLERVTVGGAEIPAVLHDLLHGDHVTEAVVLSTCNRLEIYVQVERFHGGVNEVTALLGARLGAPVSALSSNVYVHYEDAAISHLFSVAAGLDSMVVGESQVLGQLRSAYAVARAEEATGRVMHELLQQALRVGKRVRTDTGIDRAGASLVGSALDEAERVLGGLAGRRALVIGAGAMGALGGTSLRRRGVDTLVVANRTVDNAQRLATSLGARAVDMAALGTELSGADVVLTSTGATGAILTADTVAHAMTGRADRPLVLLDLALPRDVEAAAAMVPGVTYVDLDRLQVVLADSGTAKDVAEATDIVAAEVAAYLTAQRSVEVAPTVAALRSRAAEVVDAELARLVKRMPELDERGRAEVGQAVRRVVDKLLHTPTVRVKELAGEPGGESYAAVLRELFGLDPATADLSDAVTVPTDLVSETT